MYGVLVKYPYACIFAVVGYDDVMHFPYVAQVGADLTGPLPYVGSVKERYGAIRTYATFEAAEKARGLLRERVERDGELLVREIEAELGLKPSPTRSPFGDPWASQDKR